MVPSIFPDDRNHPGATSSKTTKINEVKKRWRLVTIFIVMIIPTDTMLASETSVAFALSDTPSSTAGGEKGSTASWYDGVNFESYDPKDNIYTSENHNDSSNETPATTSNDSSSDNNRARILIPCGLIIIEDERTKQQQDPYRQQQVKEEDIPDQVLPLTTIIDPNQTVSTIHIKALKRYPDIYYAVVREGHSKGGKVGSQNVIPAGRVHLRMGSIEATVPSPNLLVVEDADNDYDDDDENRPELRLGMDFLWDYGGIINHQEEEVELHVPRNTVVKVPFIRPRKSFELDYAEL